MPKRNDYISWNDYFMKLAHLTSKRSKDPNTQVGAVIVGENNKIIGVGYNGLPRGCSDDEFSWETPEKYSYVVHAELNACINANDFNSLKGATMYSTLFPCSECAKVIIQLGIKKIIYDDDKYHNHDTFVKSRQMLDAVQIPYINSLDLDNTLNIML